jgi:hypothetical protein
MHELNDQTRRHMLVRDEEVIGRLSAAVSRAFASSQ